MRASTSLAFLATVASLFSATAGTPVEGVSKRYTDVPLEHWESDEVACPWTGVGREPIPVNVCSFYFDVIRWSLNER